MNRDSVHRLPVAVRAYTERPGKNSSGSSSHPPEGWPDYVLIFDTETTPDAAQRLQFGAWQFGRWNEDGVLEIKAEGLFHADDLEESDPEGYAALVSYAEEHGLRLESRREWVGDIFFRGGYEAQALICAFNLPFDLTRIAIGCGEGRNRFYGGFSLPIFDYWNEEEEAWQEDRYKPRIKFKTIDSKRAFIEFGQPVNATAYRPGRFLDPRSLAFALTNRSHSLASACEAFGAAEVKSEIDDHSKITPERIAYCRQDVRATGALLEKLREEFDRHPVPLDPCRTYSPASLAKAYLRAMGVTPPREKFDLPPKVQGIAMQAYYGGRAECRIRGQEVPVRYVDFLSMYPTCNTLMGVWSLLTAKNIRVEDAIEEVRDLLAEVSVERCRDPEFWKQIPFFALIRPSGAVLPVRAEYEDGGRNLNIGVNPIEHGEPLWYAGPDLVASVLLTGEVPEVLEAIRLVPEGVQEGLREVRLRGQLKVDPRSEDFFQRVIEMRKNLPAGLTKGEQDQLGGFLKVLANSGAYGIFAEMNPEDLPKGEEREVEVYSGEVSYTCSTPKPESPGTYCFPPVAALTTAGARLKLALLERMVADAGGTYAFCDTDSMAVVATREGGVMPCPGGGPGVRALSWEEFDEIVQKFEKLNPYDREKVGGSVLEVEDVNFDEDGSPRELRVLAISAKRYGLFTEAESGIEVVKASEHGLGHLLNPLNPSNSSTDWITQLWELAIREHRGEEITYPAWMDRPGISRITVSSPHLQRPFRDLNEGLPYREQVKPMNFLLSAHTRAYGEPAPEDPTRFHLVAPFESEPERWMEMSWVDRASGRQWAVTTRDTPNGYVAEVKSYQHVYREYLAHPEPKSLGPDGEVCGPRTRGLLQRRPVTPLRVQYIGKESNCLEEVLAGLRHDRDEVLAIYDDDSGSELEKLRVAMQAVSPRELAQRVGASKRQIQRVKNGDSVGSPELRERIWMALGN